MGGIDFSTPFTGRPCQIVPDEQYYKVKLGGFRYSAIQSGVALAQAHFCGQIPWGLEPGEKIWAGPVVNPTQHQVFIDWINARSAKASLTDDADLEVLEDETGLYDWINPDGGTPLDKNGDGYWSNTEIREKLGAAGSDPLKFGLRTLQLRATVANHYVANWIKDEAAKASRPSKPITWWLYPGYLSVWAPTMIGGAYFAGWPILAGLFRLITLFRFKPFFTPHLLRGGASALKWSGAGAGIFLGAAALVGAIEFLINKKTNTNQGIAKYAYQSVGIPAAIGATYCVGWSLISGARQLLFHRPIIWRLFREGITPPGFIGRWPDARWLGGRILPFAGVVAALYFSDMAVRKWTSHQEGYLAPLLGRLSGRFNSLFIG